MPVANPTSKKRKNIDPNILKLRQTIHACCARNDLATAMQAFEAATVTPEAQVLYSLLSLCDGFADRPLHVGSTRWTPRPNNDKQKDGERSNKVVEPDQNGGDEKLNEESAEIKEVDLPTRLAFAEKLCQHMKDRNLPMTETAVTALVRLHCKCAVSDPSVIDDKVANLLDTAESTQQCRPKLRMYAPLLHFYATETYNMRQALQVWRRISRREGIEISEREYLALIKCATQVGSAVVMERVLSNLAEDVLVPSFETTNAIVLWFNSPASKRNDVDSHDIDSEYIHIMDDILADKTEPAPIMGPVTAHSGWIVSRDDKIDEDSGKVLTGCLQDHTLQPVHLSAAAWDTLRELNEKIVTSGKLDNDTSEFQGGRKGKKRKLNDHHFQERQKHWQALQTYLDDRIHTKKLPIDVIIDGANIGYFEQNFAGAPKHVDYDQIDWVVQHFLQQNKSVLLVMHCRHFFPSCMPRKHVPLMEGWIKNDILYRTPPGMNDDWFWMHAALSNQVSNSSSENGGNGETTTTTDASRAYPLVVTNDEMRDHHFQMLSQRSFGRWKERQQVHFKFGPWISGKGTREVVLKYPNTYSRRIQKVADGFVIPLPKRGDENRFLDGQYVLDDDTVPEAETYVAIRHADV